MTHAATPVMLHHFRVERPIAQGGMGEVFLGYDVSLERAVALKVVRPELVAAPGFTQRFLHEARAQARVVHANVVQVYFVGEDRGTLFMAMELVDGGSLEATVERRERLAWGAAAQHLIGLAEALHEAARLGIVHRDIKPANILLDRFGMAHLADFGLATPAGVPEADAGGVPAPIVGSPHYLSPEQARGEPVDARSDIYALGATFYELLTGIPAVTAKSIPEAQDFHRFRRPLPIRRLAPRVPRPLARILDRCLAPRPEDRFADHAELLQALRLAAPRPLVNARAPQRILAWALDLAVALIITRFTLQRIPLLGFVAQALWVGGLGPLLGATPGQWLMRVQLRTPDDAEVSPVRFALRFLLQHGWEAPAALGLARLYESETGPLTTALLAWGAVGLGWVALGSLPALWARSGQALHDRLTGTRVLLDIR